MTSTTNQKPHSARYFGATRNFWWHEDFIRLLGARWDLPKAACVLDVGCGIGHWGLGLPKADLRASVRTRAVRAASQLCGPCAALDRACHSSQVARRAA